MRAQHLRVVELNGQSPDVLILRGGPLGSRRGQCFSARQLRGRRAPRLARNPPMRPRTSPIRTF